MTKKKIRDLKAGDRTPWYTVLVDATVYRAASGLADEAIVRVQWASDGAVENRFWTDPYFEVSIIPTRGEQVDL